MEDNYDDYHSFTVSSSKFLTLLTKKFENRKKWQSVDPKKILSFIPGSIIEVYAKPGEKMKAGDVLLILEAMKMYNKVEMPFDGVIKEVKVKKGDRVPKNMVMITLK